MEFAFMAPSLVYTRSLPGIGFGINFQTPIPSDVMHLLYMAIGE